MIRPESCNLFFTAPDDILTGCTQGHMFDDCVYCMSTSVITCEN